MTVHDDSDKQLYAEIGIEAYTNPLADLAAELKGVAERTTNPTDQEALLLILDSLVDLAEEVRVEFEVVTTWGKKWGSGDVNWLLNNIPAIRNDANNLPVDVNSRWVLGWALTDLDLGGDDNSITVQW